MKTKVADADYANSDCVAPAATLNAGMLMIQSSGDTGNSMQLQILNYHGEGMYLSGCNIYTKLQVHSKLEAVQKARNKTSFEHYLVFL